MGLASLHRKGVTQGIILNNFSSTTFGNSQKKSTSYCAGEQNKVSLEKI